MPIGAEILAERVSRATFGVCRIEIDGNPAGTGFLIGPDTVITNYHVVERSLSQATSTFNKPLSCRFDHAELSGGGFREGRVVKVRPECLDFSAYADSDSDPQKAPPTDDELDYALLSLSEPVGDQPSPLSPTRGWISVPETTRPFVPNQSFVIIQHPLTAPKLTRPAKFLNVDTRGTRILYEGDTRPGSSGSPCLTDEYELVALHHRGDPAWILTTFKQGVPIAKIRARLMRKSLAAKMPECPGVESARTALDAIADKKGESKTAEFIEHWKPDIEETRDGILRLKVQKQLHDFLHRCQKLLPLLIMTTRSTDAANATATLELHGGNLGEDVRKIRDIAAKLPAIIRRRPVDNTRWINQIDATATALRDTTAVWPDDFLEAILKMRSEIKQQLGRINERLVDEAANMPLQNLVAAFTDLAVRNLFEGATAAGTAGAEAISRVMSDLSRFIEEHDNWQDIDGRLWVLEDYLASDTPMNRRLFAATWEDAWAPLQTLLAQSKDPAQTLQLMQLGAEIQGLTDGHDAQKLPEQFARFRRLTVNSFADLDSALLAKCDEISALHEPLRRMTE